MSSQEEQLIGPALQDDLTMDEFGNFLQNLQNPDQERIDIRLNDDQINVAQQKINLYVKSLFNYLGYEYCFLSGAFVIEDDNKQLFKLLESVTTARFTKGLTHDQYMNGNLFLEDRTYSLFEISLKQQNYIQITCPCPPPEMKGKSKSKAKIKPISETYTYRSIKYYKFNPPTSARTFVYMKIEQYPTIHPAHLTHAITRYLLRIPNTSCRLPRREDCWKDNKNKCRYHPEPQLQHRTVARLMNKIPTPEQVVPGSIPSPTNTRPPVLYKVRQTKLLEGIPPFEAPTQVTLSDKSSTETIQVREHHLRKGDEVYIPLQVSEFFLHYLMSPNFSYFGFIHSPDVNHVTVTAYNSSSGGSHKRKRKTIRKKAHIRRTMRRLRR